ncbi:MAG: hypothetical protein KAU16_05060 [Methanophagales archaeon]|nr:hypothetical protein [Methanophagales archaeon]
MLKDERGQMSIDFLAGLTLFMLTLLFLVLFIPGMFVPFQSETIDLSSVAYRTSVILVEDPGWWNKTGAGYGEDWENQNVENVSRVGLAIDKEHPNMLNMSKIDVFNNDTQITNASLTRKLGLYRTIGGNEIYYGYNIRIEDLNKNPLATRGDPIPEYGDVSSMKRLVKAQTGGCAYFDGEETTHQPPGEQEKMWINVTGIPERDIVFEITNFNVSPPPQPKFLTAEMIFPAVNPLTRGTDITNPATHYVVWKKTNTTDFVIAPTAPANIGLNRTDTLKFVIKRTVFTSTGSNTLRLNYGGIDFKDGPPIEYYDYVKPVYTSANLIVRIWT